MTLDEYLKKELKAARECAEYGNIFFMEKHLQLAIKYAERIGTDISKDVSQIENEGYKSALPLELKAARECAEKGDVLSMENGLYQAVNYAERIGKNISEDVFKIQTKCYQEAARLKLKDVEESLKRGGLLNGYHKLKMTEIYVKRFLEVVGTYLSKIGDEDYKKAL